MKKSMYSWALYDWANSAFATTVMAGFFPIFFAQYWSNPDNLSVSTFYLGLGNSIASMIIVFLAPNVYLKPIPSLVVYENCLIRISRLLSLSTDVEGFDRELTYSCTFFLNASTSWL